MDKEPGGLQSLGLQKSQTEQLTQQEVFPTQGLNPGLLHCRHVFYHLSPK